MLNQQNQNRMSAPLIGDERAVLQKSIRGLTDARLRNRRTQRSFISTLLRSLFSANHCDLIGPSHRPPFPPKEILKSTTHMAFSSGYLIRETVGKLCNPDVVNKQTHPASPVTERNLSSAMTLERINQMSWKIMPRQILNSLLRDEWLSCHFIPTKQ